MSNSNGGWPTSGQIQQFVEQFHVGQQVEREKALHNALFGLTVAKMACEILSNGKQHVLMLREEDLQQAIQFLRENLIRFSNELALLGAAKDKTT